MQISRFYPAIVLFGLLALSACETATPYQPLNMPHAQASGGYSDKQIDADHFTVTFAGNSLTERRTVEDYLLYRAAELTLAQGKDWFIAADRKTDTDTRTWVDPTPYPWGGYWRPYWGFHHRARGWAYGYYGDPFWGDPFWGSPLHRRGPGLEPWPADVTEITRYEASATIALGSGPKPKDAAAFDAREVIAHLGPSVKRPPAP